MDLAFEEAMENVCSNRTPLVIVVVAGWNAEPEEISSTREALCAKHLSLCHWMDEFVYWARLHPRQFQRVPTLRTSLPKVLYQTFKEEILEAKTVSEAALPPGFTRELHTDEECENLY